MGSATPWQKRKIMFYSSKLGDRDEEEQRDMSSREADRKIADLKAQLKRKGKK